MVTDNKYHENVSLKMVSVLGEMGEDAFCQGEGWMFSGLPRGFGYPNGDAQQADGCTRVQLMMEV